MLKKISKETIKKVVKNCFPEPIISIKHYAKGHINTIYEIRLKNRELLLRIFNESWKAKKEAFIYQKIRKNSDIPIPEIYSLDDSKKILPRAYLLMSKIEGKKIDESYKKYRNRKLFEKAGEILAKLHKIKFQDYGWIIGNKVCPKFRKWEDFVRHDIAYKLKNIKADKILISQYLNENSYLLKIKNKPCLLHKDYHCSHILTDKENIKGIIDVEWATAGHNENDLIKMELWAFKRIKSVRGSFFKGYLNHGSISCLYPERKKLYELWHWINMINISHELKNKSWLDYNTKSLKKFLKTK